MQIYNNVHKVSIIDILSNSYKRVPIDLSDTLDSEDNIIAVTSIINPPKPSNNTLQVGNVHIEPEVNCFILSWQNPNDKGFKFVQIRMDNALDSDSVCFENSEVIYSGNGNTFTYYVDKTAENCYYQFWIKAFNGEVIPTKDISLWIG